jgi:hypothetical protein
VGNLAGGRRREKGRRAVIPLAGWSETRRRECVPLARWPERWWGVLLRALGAPRKLDAPGREAVRGAIRRVVELYERALRMPEPSDEEIRDGIERLRDMAGKVAADGCQLGFPRTPKTRLMRTLVEIFGHDMPVLVEESEESLSFHDLLTRRPLEPAQLAFLVERLAPGAWRFRSGPRGHEGTWALAALVSRLHELAVRVSGKRLTFSVYEGNAGERTTYGGSLLAVVQILQPALPRVAGSIADCNTATLVARLKAVHEGSRRRQVAPIS